MLSSSHILAIAATATGEWTVIPLTRRQVEWAPGGLRRLEQVAAMTGAPLVYCDWLDGTVPHPLTDCLEGSLRDDFDFGHLVVVPTPLLKEVAAEMTGDYKAAGWYDLRLRLMRRGRPFHLAETLYSAGPENKSEDSEAQFSYVDPRNRASQIEMEQVFTEHLKAIGAYLAPSQCRKTDVSRGEFPVEASVIIPVRNRCRTIRDAVRSALSQVTDFPFNVIVVDNRSDDGTAEILAEIAAEDPRLVVKSTASIPYPAIGIGGCWNIAICSEECGRFAVQLDSDDLYSSESVLRRIVDKFREEQCAMVVGSYTLTDFDGNTIPPGLIDHAEWTDGNGRNNALRINGLGAPRAFYTPVAREIRFPDTCYGEDYAMGLAISRSYGIGRIYESLYLCRRWEDNTDHALPLERINRNNLYKDSLRTAEILKRQQINEHTTK